MADHALVRPKRRSRVWLYAPYALLLVLALLWSAAWLVIRERTTRGLDEWLATEAAGGRAWTCAERSVGGYPFRMELACAALRLSRPGLEADFGRLLVVSQIYDPRHVIAELGGPLRLTAAGAASVEAGWRLLQVSLAGATGGFERLSLSADAPTIRIAPLPGGPFPPDSEVTLTGEHLELHVRPGSGEPGRYQAAFSARQAVIPGLADLIGGQEPADLDLDLAATEIRNLAARSLPEEAERWRAAGGVLDITRLRLAKGARRIEGRGRLGLDEAHRPQGQLDLATARLEGLIGSFTNGRAAAAGALIGILTGRPPVRAEQPEGTDQRGSDTLRPLPPLSLAKGRVQIGPIAVPGLRLPALY